VSRYGDRVFDDAVIAEAGRRLLEAAPPQTRVILMSAIVRRLGRRSSTADSVR
jgi:hypothetical protein